MVTIPKPNASEYAPYYAPYIDAIPQGNILEILEKNLDEITDRLGDLTDEQGNFRYEAGKWSIKDVLGHIIDAERVFAYRCLRVARLDKTPLPGFDQDDYVLNHQAEKRTLYSLLKELESVRMSTIALFESLAPETYEATGVASDKPVSVKALIYIAAGHTLHHWKVLQTRYLPHIL
ncbi:MAG TPA: DNA damage-inducible protein DinB [Microscillaceae bacterium]|jgi:uncharacterized damage-inducible protein DinB|nr:DNA damage-inducible protein DinB [Microscillaceae bacterium]